MRIPSNLAFPTMPPRRLISLLGPVVLLLAAYAQTAPAAAHVGSEPRESEHGHAGHDARHAPVDAPEIDVDHVPWETDAPLREGMRRMRDAIASVDDPGSSALLAAQALDAAAEIDQAAAFMFANCKLAQAPDIALHGLLARLMAGAQALRQESRDTATLAAMRAVLLDYDRLFDDPTLLWAEPAHDNH